MVSRDSREFDLLYLRLLTDMDNENVFKAFFTTLKNSLISRFPKNVFKVKLL